MTVFHAPTKILFDLEALEGVESIWRESGWRAVGVVVDAAVAELPAGAALVDRLGALGELVVHVHRGGEPTVELVDQVTDLMRSSGPDALVAVGGGSVMDLAKAVAVMLTNPGSSAEYQGLNLVKQPGLPVVCVPTTAGTGAEVTWAAVLTDQGNYRKLGISSPLVFPAYAVLDPRLTVGLPAKLTISTGMDAIAHAVESYTATGASLISRMLSVQALGLLERGLALAVGGGAEPQGRREAMLGATLAGLACTNAGVGAAHALAYPLGVHFGVPHGEAITLVLTSSLRAFEARRPGIYRALDELGDGGLADRVDRLVKQAGYRGRLRDHGVRRSDLPRLAEEATQIPAIGNQPVRLSAAACHDVLAKVL